MGLPGWEVGTVPDENANSPPSAAYPRCEVCETLKGGYCEFAGEVEFKGVLLCVWHARQFEAQDRVDLLTGILSCLDLSLSNIPLHKDKNLTLLVQEQRAQANREHAYAHHHLQRAHEDTRKLWGRRSQGQGRAR
jgi:hypothetical protein